MIATLILLLVIQVINQDLTEEADTSRNKVLKSFSSHMLRQAWVTMTLGKHTTSEVDIKEYNNDVVFQSFAIFSN